MYHERRHNRNSDATVQPIVCDLDDVSTITKENLLCALCRFVCEFFKKKTGNKFPPRTLRYIILIIQMYVEKVGFSWRLTDDPELDNNMKDNATEGLGSETKSAEPLEVGEIDRLWRNGLLGEGTPLQLVQTVIFL